MPLFGRSWDDDEPTYKEKEEYKRLTGVDFQGPREELKKQVERDIDDGFTSRGERSGLLDFRYEDLEDKEK